ncbi:hypothetical protein KBY57_13970 [Cyanobium sp. Aljojuca 7D2]|uniref:hypothetical protein n=1 Tax=Cyanobium sp. Aljojuca 7D2 TaxID=2823698 RepID=UPI0020CC9427|nr:hypothetical protein [Cyanobium sp. Aljojuca 7D2]MCP9892148.1 hypothetical protein [Cyanobium sp. Aljojuca 7D2]
MLDKLELLTGYYRKSLLRLLNRHPSPTPDGVEAMEEKGELKPHPCRRYGPEAAAAQVPFWEASDRLCGKRLVAVRCQSG